MVNLPNGKLQKVLKFLSLESASPIRAMPEGYARTTVRWQMPRERIARILNLRRAEQQRMREYLESRDCLMQFLSRELNDPQARPCGKCANCTEGLSGHYPAELAAGAAAFLNRIELPIEPRKQWPSGVSFEGMHGNIQPAHRSETGRALCRWGDPGYGEQVRRGKLQTGRFSEDLVQAAVSLIRRWAPQPSPGWLTCVPSRRHQHLVPRFTRELAQALGLPFVDCIAKVRVLRNEEPADRFQQVRNLEDAFASMANWCGGTCSAGGRMSIRVDVHGGRSQAATSRH